MAMCDTYCHVISKYQLKGPIYILHFEAFAAVFLTYRFLETKKGFG